MKYEKLTEMVKSKSFQNLYENDRTKRKQTRSKQGATLFMNKITV